jgi:hypothetical protein
VQLFGVPLAIVAVAVTVWLLFGKIAASHRTPSDYLEDLHSPNFERRWSAARDLASILPHKKDWQEDEQFADKLAAELDRQLDDGASGPTELHYAHFIAQTLGEFRSLAGVAVLRRALTDTTDRDIREAALMGLGKLADRVGGLNDSNAVADLVAATRDDDPTIRVKATWILGLTDNEQAIPGLIPLLGNADPEIRLNAASSLVRLGSTAGFDVLAEMLDMDEVRQGLKARGLTPSQIESQSVAIPWSALQSLLVLLQKAPDTDLETFRTLAERLAKNDNKRIAISAEEVLINLNRAQSK